MKLSARLFLISSSVAAAATASSFEIPASDKHARIQELQPQSCAEGHSSFVGSGVVPLVSLKASVEYSAHVCFDESTGVAVGEFFDSPLSDEASHVMYHVHCAARDGAGGIFFGAEIDYMSEKVRRTLSSSSEEKDDPPPRRQLTQPLRAQDLPATPGSLSDGGRALEEQPAPSKSRHSRSRRGAPADAAATATSAAPEEDEPTNTFFGFLGALGGAIVSAIIRFFAILFPPPPPPPVPCGCDACPADCFGSDSFEQRPDCFPVVCEGDPGEIIGGVPRVVCDGCTCGARRLQEEQGVMLQHANGKASKNRELGEIPQGTLTILYFGTKEEKEEVKELFGLRLFADYDHSCESFATQMKDFDMDQDVGPFVSGDFSISGPAMN